MNPCHLIFFYIRKYYNLTAIIFVVSSKKQIISNQVSVLEKFMEIFSYKRLLYYFAWRDIKVRYKQTLFGALWVVLQPLALMTIFSIFLSKIGRGATGNTPYPIYLYAALTFWGYFAAILNTVSASVISSGGLMKKIYFPRIIPALAGALVASVDFIVSFGVFLMLFVVFRTQLNIEGILILPLLIIITVSMSLGVGLIFAALNARYRDVKQALPFIIQAWFFLTPVIYPLSIVPERYQPILFLNPMTGVVVAARDAFFSGGISSWTMLAESLVVALSMLVLGLVYFFKHESTFVDTV